MVDIETEQTKLSGDPRKIIQILKIIKISHVTIQMIEFTQAEKFLRKLIVNHDCDPFHPQKQQHAIIKSVSRVILN